MAQSHMTQLYPSSMSATTLVSFPPRCRATISTSSTKKQRADKKRTVPGNVIQVVQHDVEFVCERLRLAVEPLRPVHDRVSEVLRHFFWLRFLEDPRYHLTPREMSSWPPVTYPPGLSGLDILMADVEAFKTYADDIHYLFEVWTMPLPESYDPERVQSYFSCRPHILIFRILQVLSSFSYAVIRLQLTRIFKLSMKDVNENSFGAEYHVGQFLKETMLNLGPTFIKLGQSLSTRPDIIGSEISKALSKLHDKVPPFSRALAMKIIEEELGGAVESYFSFISEEPIAAASFGQVYKGCTLDGCIVAIKVQRPNLLHSVTRDIYIFRLGLDFLRKAAKRKNDLCLYADELGKGFVGELDYRIESANASDFLEAHSRYSFMSVPKVLGHLTRKRVLTMEYLLGESPNNLLLASEVSSEEVDEFTKIYQMEARSRLLDLVNKGVQATLVQLLETGLLHADPHPGNLCYTSEGCIGFYDFGLLCRMKKEHQIAMLASIVHIVNGDWGGLVYDLASMDVVLPGTNLHLVTSDLVETLEEVNYRDGVPDIKFSLVLGKILSIALKYHFRVPPYYTLVLRSLASFEGLAVAADKDFRTFQAACPYVINKLLYDNSASTRRILYSVVFNKAREIQWQKILLFLKISSLRMMSIGIDSSASKIPVHQKSEQDASDLAKVMLRLLPSKHGAVLRRLMMMADPISLTRAMVSKDAIMFRKHASMVLAEVICRWLHNAVIGNKTSSKYTELEEAADQFCIILRDRRLKLIFYRIVGHVRKHPLLMVKSCWSCFTIIVMALVISLPQTIAKCSESLFNSLAFVPRKFAVRL